MGKLLLKAAVAGVTAVIKSDLFNLKFRSSLRYFMYFPRLTRRLPAANPVERRSPYVGSKFHGCFETSWWRPCSATTDPASPCQKIRTFCLTELSLKENAMSSRLCIALLAVLVLPGCNNTLNPFCGSARPAPVIGSLSPSTIAFAQVEQGATLTVNGSNFVAASEIMINGRALAANVVSSQQMKILLTNSVISGPGSVSVKVTTPSGNSSDLGCSSGGTTSALTLTVN